MIELVDNRADFERDGCRVVVQLYKQPLAENRVDIAITGPSGINFSARILDDERRRAIERADASIEAFFSTKAKRDAARQ